MYVLYIAAGLVSLLLGILELGMIIRVFAFLIPALDDSGVMDLVCMITDPIILPVRAFFQRFSIFRNSPIDFSFVIAFLLLSIIQTAMSYWTDISLR